MNMPTDSSKPRTRRRLAPADREQQIVEKAIAVFAENGFSASTRDLAEALGVTQPLLYRYFATKEDLVERVYEEVFFRPWNNDWEKWLTDRGTPLGDRLRHYLKDYAQFIMRSNLVRLHMFAGLAHSPLVHRFIDNLRETHFKVIAQELRHEFGIRHPASPDEEADEIELVWATHSTVFYMGVRQWIYGLPAPKDINRTIDMLVDSFLVGAPGALKRLRS
uniref:Transcriptional regulator, TetR family n=1 Tax=Caulobacter sp. (strain K31) TaxID=366602 RepID=B0T6N9_CAUSK